MKLWYLLFLAWMGLTAWMTPSHSRTLHDAKLLPENRALVVVLNMYTADRGAILNRWYQWETRASEKKLKKHAAPHYGKVIWLVGNQARAETFVATLADLNRQPQIRAIDAVVYVHGLPQDLNFVVGTNQKDQPIVENKKVAVLSQQIAALGSRKLRMLYSDACYSGHHLSHWLNAGFKAVAGAEGVDSNQGRDVKKFFKAWGAHATFERSIRRANRELTYRLFDLTQKDGNSFKVAAGQMHLTIDTPVE